MKFVSHLGHVCLANQSPVALGAGLRVDHADGIRSLSLWIEERYIGQLLGWGLHGMAGRGVKRWVRSQFGHGTSSLVHFMLPPDFPLLAFLISSQFGFLD